MLQVLLDSRSQDPLLLSLISNLKYTFSHKGYLRILRSINTFMSKLFLFLSRINPLSIQDVTLSFLIIIFFIPDIVKELETFLSREKESNITGTRKDKCWKEMLSLESA